MRILVLALAGFASFCLVACDDSSPSGSDGGASPMADGGGGGVDAGGSSSTCGMAGRTGRTTCEVSAGGTCPSGQYCNSMMLMCSPGCTADDNCGESERCVREAGAAVGACEPCPTCGNGVCDPGETGASCAADCGMAVQCGDGRCDAGEMCPADCGGPEPGGLADCIEECDDHVFFNCVESAEACAALCESASEAKRQGFLACSDPTQCTTYAACLPRLQ